MRKLSFISGLFCLAATAGATPASALSLSFIGQQTFATGFQYGGTTVGGLSGIDYRPGTNDFIAISDDRSQTNAARYYTLSLGLTSAAFSSVTFTGVNTLVDTGNAPYAPLAIDPESIRALPGGNFVYTGEGDKNNNINAFIRIANGAGHVSELALPAIFQQTGPAGTTGLRNNLAFESVTVSPDGSTITTATENALIQDGPAAAFGIASPSRILTFDAATGTPGAQYVYEVDAITDPSVPSGAFSTAGLVELLDLGGGKYLAVERSFVTGLVKPWSTTGNGIKIFEIDLAGATDVSTLASLTGQGFTAVSKTLLLDLDTLQIPLDNIEGISWGPTLEDGSRSLILVSDNNFSGTQFTQFLAFKVGGAVPEPASWAMMVIGFGLLGASLRQHRAVRVAFA